MTVQALKSLSQLRQRIKESHLNNAPNASVAIAQVLEAIRLEEEAITPMFESGHKHDSD